MLRTRRSLKEKAILEMVWITLSTLSYLGSHGGIVQDNRMTKNYNQRTRPHSLYVIQFWLCFARGCFGDGGGAITLHPIPSPIHAPTIQLL